MKKCFALILAIAMVAAMMIVPSFAKDPAAGDKITYEFSDEDIVWESDEDQGNPDKGAAPEGWSYNSGNLEITFDNGYMFGSQFSNGDGSAQLRKWGTNAADCDPLITGFVFNIKAVGNTAASYGIYGDVGGYSNAFVRVQLNADTQQYDITVKNGDNYDVVKTNVSMNEDHNIDAIFYCGESTYVVSLDGIVLGVFTYFGEFDSANNANARIDLLGENATIGVKSFYVATGSATVEENLDPALTGDASIIAVAVIAVALAAVVVLRKRETV